MEGGGGIAGDFSNFYFCFTFLGTRESEKMGRTKENRVLKQQKTEEINFPDG